MHEALVHCQLLLTIPNKFKPYFLMIKHSYKTTCSYCGVGCGVIVNKDSSGKLSVEGDPEHPANRGMLCSKGMNLHHVAQDQSDRILYPEMRWNKYQKRKRVSWDTAINRTSAIFKTFIKKYGPDSVGFYVSGQCLTEEYYLVNKLTKGFIGTNNIDTNSRLCMSSAVAGYIKTVGEDIVPINYDDIELSDCILIAGANPAWCHPILFRRIEAHKEQHPETKLIVIDPRRTQSAALADIHLPIQPGTDIVLYLTIGRLLIEYDYIDWQFIHDHTDGFEAYREIVMQQSLEKAARICEVPKEDIIQAALCIGQSKAFLSMWAMGLNQSVVGLDKNLSLLNLSLITGQIGKPGAGPFSLTGQPNAMGGREVGGMANLLAAHRLQGNAQHRQEVADFWGVEELPTKPGLTATQMFDALNSGKLKAIWIICTNPLVSLPDARMAEQALEKARFVVVQDISHRSDTAAYADLLLPAAGWGEKEGTMTNSDRRITYLPKFIDPPEEARPDADILCDFAQKMGYEGFDYKSVSEVYDEHCLLTKGTNIDISGLSHARLKKEGSFQWPVPHATHSGTPRLFLDQEFYTTNKKAQILSPQQILNQSEVISDEFPLILTTGRIRDQWHTMTKTGKVNKLKSHIPRPFLEIHPNDAKARGIVDEDLVQIENQRGKVEVLAKLSKDIKPGVVFLPMHWGKIGNNDLSRANNLTNNLYDPISKEPDFKFSAVNVSLLKKKKQKIAIIGAGSAAYGFIETYRKKNWEDEIHVFSKEPYPFYNRILLPDYVNDHLKWEELVKMTKLEAREKKLHLHCGKGIEKINPQSRTIWDQDGIAHVYDILIMATGSRSFVPRDFPAHIPQVHTLRSRQDADRLKEQLAQKSSAKVVIAGGGLLGLELAGSLKEMDVEVAIIQRASRLMERPLDIVASRLLLEEIKDREIDVFFNNEIQTVFEDEEQLKVTLRSGKTMYCDAVVYAIGTRPNSELAQAAGIHCGRGVRVNQHMQTSDSNTYAIGEIAEFEQQMYGITAAAEEQATIAAHHILGDQNSMYKGSVPMNILKFSGMQLCSLGTVQVSERDTSYEIVSFLDERKRFYKKCVIQNDRLVGAILMGDVSEMAEFKTLIKEQLELDEKRDSILRTPTGSVPVLGKLVCSCNQIGEGNLQQCIQKGCTDFETLCKTTGAGSGCGSCKPEVRQILENLLIPV